MIICFSSLLADFAQVDEALNISDHAPAGPRRYARQVQVPDAVKLTWLVLGGDPAARSHRVEQFTAL